ncbi:ceramide synthase 1-like isoform X2 [Bradysia coprophila]|uniref:ceramide synthase 1-like isoform X2 n=1 Tax=Bradysia coprophila TaxID=38358 RepID=UPI00187DBF32|nr:ceramide synthase 1-like isoform X2 [Bradysia coprophila]
MCNDSYWSASVRYDQFAVDSYKYLSYHLDQLRTEYRCPQQFFEHVAAVTRNNKDPLIFIYITIFAVGWTVLRSAFSGYLPIAEKCKLPLSEKEKLPESAWKFCFYFASWLLAAYILIVKERGESLLRPESVWSDWQFTAALPIEYHVLYVVQLSFYLHSIYATVVTDCWRKDSIVQLLHHLITMALIFFGFSIRGHKAGTVVLFLHDICDVLLEGTKTAHYFRMQGERKYRIFELIANVGFLLFAFVWFCSRLYAFPLRMIWYCLSERNMQVPLLCMLVIMLDLLLAMNLYWFTFILKLLWKVATGNDELKDVREYEEKTEDDKSSNSSTTIKSHQIENNQVESIKARHNNLRKRSQIGIRSD